MRKFLLIFFASTGFALLPPFAQSIKEIQALVTSPELYEILGSSEPIMSIDRTETGYLILTTRRALDVQIIYGGGDRRIIGPARFEFVFGDPTSR